MKSLLRRLVEGLDTLAPWLAPLVLRLFLAWEFWQSGMDKYRSLNWFYGLRELFPYPFHLLPAELSWHLALWLELIGAVSLLLGLGTRFFALVLSGLTIVAIMAVQVGAGYNVCGNGWKLSAIYLLLLFTLIIGGPGKASLDGWLRRRYFRNERRLWI